MPRVGCGVTLENLCTTMGGVMLRNNLAHFRRGTPLLSLLLAHAFAWAQQPPEPVDPTPQDGEVYALMNQATGLQLTGNASVQSVPLSRLNDGVVQSTRDF